MMLIAANKAISTRVRVLIFAFIKKFLPSTVITTLKRMECLILLNAAADAILYRKP
jgi:hypothetical protein